MIWFFGGLSCDFFIFLSKSGNFMTKKTVPESAIRVLLVVAGILGMAKLFVGFWTGSLAVLASAVDSVFDFFSSAGNFWAARKSRAAPTRFFPYGFGKIEGIFSLSTEKIITTQKNVEIFVLIFQKSPTHPSVL